MYGGSIGEEGMVVVNGNGIYLLRQQIRKPSKLFRGNVEIKHNGRQFIFLLSCASQGPTVSCVCLCDGTADCLVERVFIILAIIWGLVMVEYLGNCF